MVAVVTVGSWGKETDVGLVELEVRKERLVLVLERALPGLFFVFAIVLEPRHHQHVGMVELLGHSTLGFLESQICEYESGNKPMFQWQSQSEQLNL